MAMPSEPIFVSVQTHNFCLNEQQQALFKSCNANAEIGAVASFVGLVRAENNIMEAGSAHSGKLRALYIEHYPAMTEPVLRRLCEQVLEKWQLITCRVIHRVGTIPTGEQIVLVMVGAEHRAAAFAACECIMDHLKTSAPFWKKAIFEHDEHWVAAKQSDQAKVEQWSD